MYLCVVSGLVRGLNLLQHFDCNAACCVLKLSDWSAVRTEAWKEGPWVKGVEGPTRGVLEEEGLWWTSWFLRALCVGYNSKRGPLHTKKRGRASLREDAGTLTPAAGSMGRLPVHPFKSQIRCSLSWSSWPFIDWVTVNVYRKKSKHCHPTSYTTHSTDILPLQTFLSVLQVSPWRRGHVPATERANYEGCVSSPLPPTRLLTIENIIHVSRL